MSKARSTVHTITKEQFEDLAGRVSWHGTVFSDSDGIMWYATVPVEGCPVTVMHNVTEDRFLASIARGPGAEEARRAIGVA